MTLKTWLIFILIIQLVHGLGTWKLYIKAGRKAWEAFIPIYNGIVLMKIINRHWSWVILLFLPIINLIMFPVVWVETARSFGKNTTIDTILAIVSLGFYNYYLNYIAQVTYVENRSREPKSNLGEWVSSILFAIVAATIVHTYCIQPYIIPTSSLEKTLLVGDFLFVSKMHFGARTPMTTIAMPMLHDAIPLTGMKSYASKPQLPYFRLPKFQDIKRNEIVVFNWPADTLVVITDANKGTRYKPLDKRSNYVKRCVGLPGDSLEVKNGYVYINGKQNSLPDRSQLQFAYIAEIKGRPFNNTQLANRYDITDFPQYNQNNTVALFPSISNTSLNKFKNHPNIIAIERYNNEDHVRDPSIFPHDPNYNWNNDFFGPIYIPKAETSVALNLEVLPLYKRLITEYEKNTLRVEGNQIYINDELTNSYTFKQNYYWMMGDNRNNSQDARSWGYVPFDHVVGKPVFIWMSWDTNAKGINKIRWKRLFTTVHGSGKPVSYFVPFLILLFGWFAFSKWRKRKKA